MREEEGACRAGLERGLQNDQWKACSMITDTACVDHDLRCLEA